MEQSDLLRKLTLELERLGIRYLITGSTATIVFGEPRFTNDIDVVVELGVDQVGSLCDAFPGPDFYCSKAAADQAARQHFQFNILHPASGLKIDVIVADDTEFNRSRFARRLRAPAGPDFDVWFSSPEDVIVKKLEFFQQGGSEKHIRDIIGVMKIQAEKIDRAYIATWAERMQLTEPWVGILERLDGR